MKRTITATYDTYQRWSVPKDVPLLSKEENDKHGCDTYPWSWWIKWGSLHYYDDKGKQHTLDGEESGEDMKWPNEIEEEEVECECEDEWLDDEFPCALCGREKKEEAIIAKACEETSAEHGVPLAEVKAFSESLDFKAMKDEAINKMLKDLSVGDIAALKAALENPSAEIDGDTLSPVIWGIIEEKRAEKAALYAAEVKSEIEAGK